MYQAPLEHKLPAIYLLDSIVKNVPHPYAHLFGLHIADTFCDMFASATYELRRSMMHLLQTWAPVFPAPALHEINSRIAHMNPASASTAAHVNPRHPAIIVCGSPQATAAPATATAITTTAVPHYWRCLQEGGEGGLLRDYHRLQHQPAPALHAPPHALQHEHYYNHHDAAAHGEGSSSYQYLERGVGGAYGDGYHSCYNTPLPPAPAASCAVAAVEFMPQNQSYHFNGPARVAPTADVAAAQVCVNYSVSSARARSRSLSLSLALWLACLHACSTRVLVRNRTRYPSATPRPLTRSLLVPLSLSLSNERNPAWLAASTHHCSLQWLMLAPALGVIMIPCCCRRGCTVTLPPICAVCYTMAPATATPPPVSLSTRCSHDGSAAGGDTTHDAAPAAAASTSPRTSRPRSGTDGRLRTAATGTARLRQHAASAATGSAATGTAVPVHRRSDCSSTLPPPLSAGRQAARDACARCSAARRLRSSGARGAISPSDTAAWHGAASGRAAAATARAPDAATTNTTNTTLKAATTRTTYTQTRLPLGGAQDVRHCICHTVTLLHCVLTTSDLLPGARRDLNVIEDLYGAYPYQCSTCAFRFYTQEEMTQHMDWHFRMNRREKERISRAISRSWFPTKQVRTPQITRQKSHEPNRAVLRNGLRRLVRKNSNKQVLWHEIRFDSIRFCLILSILFD